VVAYRHQAPWVDVNDAGSLAAAEELVERYRPALDW
jgi:NDP-sugar pyrophosphorylase family protein